jgi:hypothetical protein
MCCQWYHLSSGAARPLLLSLQLLQQQRHLRLRGSASSLLPQ